MAIEIISSKGLVNKKGIKILLYGNSGVGKSSQFKYTGKTILISAESGELVLNDANNVDVIRVKTLADLKEAYLYVEQNTNKYDTVGIDSLTEVGQMIVADLKKDPEFSSMKDGMKLWMKFSEIMLSIAKSFRDLDGINVIITALSESVKNGFDELIMPMIPAKKVQAQLPSLYDEVLYLRSSENGDREFVTNPAKDRSGKLEPVEPCTKEQGIKLIYNKILKGE